MLITKVPVFSYGAYLNGFEAGKSITWGIGTGGPWKSGLFWAPMALASLVAISEPKKVSISRAHSLQCPSFHENNRYINSYYDS